MHTLLLGLPEEVSAAPSSSLIFPSSINCAINSSDTLILRHPDGVFCISKGWQLAAFFRNAFFESLDINEDESGDGWDWDEAKEATVTNERTDWKKCLGRRKYLWPS